MTDPSLNLPAIGAPDTVDPAAMVAISFLAGFPNANTRDAYRTDLRIFFEWSHRIGVHPLAMKRVHIQSFASYLSTERNNSPASVSRRVGTIAGYYGTAVIDEVIEHSPAHHIKLPKIQEDPAKRTWLTRWEFGAVMRAAKESKQPADWAVVTLLGTLGMRVTAVCNVQIEDMSTDPSGYRFIHTIGKGSKPSQKVLPIPTWRAIDRAKGDRTSGPLLLRRDGTQMTRRSAARHRQGVAPSRGVPRATARNWPVLELSPSRAVPSARPRGRPGA